MTRMPSLASSSSSNNQCHHKQDGNNCHNCHLVVVFSITRMPSLVSSSSSQFYFWTVGQTNYTKISLTASTAPHINKLNIFPFFFFFFFLLTKFAYLLTSKMQKKFKNFDIKPQKVTFSPILEPFPIFSHNCYLLKYPWKLVQNTYKP